MDLATVRELYRRCQDEPVGPGDDRFTDLDRDHARGETWVSRLAKRVRLAPADKPSWSLVSGLPGSGKSTELRRLKAHLEKLEFLVALVDAEDTFDLTQEVDLTDIIAILVSAAEASVLAIEKRPPAGRAGYLERLWGWLTLTEVELQSFEINGGPVQLGFEMKANPAFRQQIRAALTRHFGKFIEEAQAELKQLDDRARAAGRQGLCLILDSLEKLRGLSSNWKDVLESAERVFRSGAPHLKLPVHCIFTVPPALVFRLAVDVEFMPVVKLRDREGKEFESGFAALVELVERRMADERQGREYALQMLRELLGPDFQARLHQLIRRSGGYARQVVKSLIWLLELEKHPASDLDLERLDNETRERFRAVVTTEMIPRLAKIAIDKNIEIPTEADRPLFDQAIQNNLVLRYLNAGTWCDLHPAVHDIPAVKRQIAEIRKAKRQKDEPSETS